MKDCGKLQRCAHGQGLVLRSSRANNAFIITVPYPQDLLLSMPKVDFGTEWPPITVDTDDEELLIFDTKGAVLLCEKMLAGEYGRLKKLRWVSFDIFFSICLWPETCVENLTCGFVWR